MNPRLADKILRPSDAATVGRYTYGTPKIVSFGSSGPMKIGKFCSIADEVTFINGGEHILNRSTTYPLNLLFDEQSKLPWHEKSKGPIVIGNDVWIGYGATILSGVSIGDGAVIGARSVVTRNVGDYEIWAGNPAKKLHTRKRPHLADWWERPIEEIRDLAEELLRSIK